MNTTNNYVFLGHPHLAPILMEACEPKIETNGRLYQDSVLGALLSLSVLPRTATSMHEFFDNPTDQVCYSITTQVFLFLPFTLQN